VVAVRYRRDLGHPFAGRLATDLPAGERVEPPWLETEFVRARLGG
jgi:hypothetical protein